MTEKILLFLIFFVFSIYSWEYPNTYPPPREFGDGCPRTINNPTLCAIVWRDKFCRGSGLQLEPEDRLENLGIELNDNIKVATIKENCVLFIFDDIDFGGKSDVLRNPGFHPIRTVGWNGTYQTIGISSISCSCPEYNFGERFPSWEKGTHEKLKVPDKGFRFRSVYHH
ncbi:hypothetical protein FO519_006173 [Halicephalobus sp. NKZ332]|nr:hypothetical protein FO519_006173 [Halicephalobus sp. NKZ332]